MRAFDQFWIEGGTEEGDSKIQQIRELLVMRYLYRQEKAFDEEIGEKILDR